MKYKAFVASLIVIPVLMLTACTAPDALSVEVVQAKAEAANNDDPTKGWVFVTSETTNDDSNWPLGIYTTTVWMKCEGTSLIKMTARPELPDDSNKGSYVSTKVKTPNAKECAESE